MSRQMLHSKCALSERPPASLLPSGVSSPVVVCAGDILFFRPMRLQIEVSESQSRCHVCFEFSACHRRDVDILFTFPERSKHFKIQGVFYNVFERVFQHTSSHRVYVVYEEIHLHVVCCVFSALKETSEQRVALHTMTHFFISSTYNHEEM